MILEVERFHEAAAAQISRITGGGLDVLIHNAARMESENLYKSFPE